MIHETANLSLDALLAHTDDGIFAIDEERRVLLFSPACERLTGFEASEVVGSGCQCSDVVECQDQQGRSLAGCLCPGFQVVRGERPTGRQIMRITTKSGAFRWIETAYAPLPLNGSGRDGIVGVMRDVTETVERERELRERLESLRLELDRFRGSDGASSDGQSEAPASDQANRLDEKLAAVERQAILNALKTARGQRSLAAKMMGISRSRLYRRMEALGIVPSDTGI